MWGRKGCGERRDVGKGEERFGKGGEGYGKVGRDEGVCWQGGEGVNPMSTPQAPPPYPAPSPSNTRKRGGSVCNGIQTHPFFLVQFLSRMITDHSVINLDNSYIIIWSLVTILRAFPQYPIELLIIVRSFLEHCLIFIALGKKWWNDLECYWNDAQVLIL